MISQGKSPEAAYRLAISGIGDINEILGGSESPCPPSAPQPTTSWQSGPGEDKKKRIRQAAAIAMYILCPVPLFIFGNIGTDVMGLCLMFVLIAAATALLIMNKDEKSEDKKAKESHDTDPRNALKKSIGTMIWTAGFVCYLLISFTTQAWYVTWVIFPIIGALRGLVYAAMDLREATNHEN